MNQELVKKIVKVGNSAGVVLPRDWIGGSARVELIRKPLNIQGDVLELLKRYLPSILGIYLVGSYARGEEGENSDVDILVVSKKIRKRIVSGKYNIDIYPIDAIEKTIEKNPLMIYPRIAEAKAIFNESLLEGFFRRFDENSFDRFVDETKSILDINREIIMLDKEIGEFLSSPQVVYSLLLRLRGLFLADCLILGKRYRKKDFFARFSKEIGKEEFVKLYEIYEGIRDRKRIVAKVKISLVEKLFSLVEVGVGRYGE